MRDEPDDVLRLAADLELLRRGRLSVTEFRARYQTNGGDTLFDAIAENLEHYLSDGDIRARDPAYRAMQEAELTKLIGLLESGAPAERLRRITFLASSEG
jgi:hypothetical protein